jgi:hypothetical protein
MPETEFSELEQKLEAVLAELKGTKDPNLRRRLLLDMRMLLLEADRLLLESLESE